MVAWFHGSGGDVHQANMLPDGIIGSRLIVMEKADQALHRGHQDEFLRIIKDFFKV